jgi:alkyl sulfatase BDS1-like metallo-beta-lactamase superfamily hydrolase
MRRIVLLLSLLSLPLTASSAERDKSTPQEVFDAMCAAFRPEKAIGAHVRYQFLISGPQGGEWWIEVNDGKNKMGRGRIENPDVTLVVSDKDWVALSNGKLSGVWASLTGRLKVRGSQTLARKLDEMFP